MRSPETDAVAPGIEFSVSAEAMNKPNDFHRGRIPEPPVRPAINPPASPTANIASGTVVIFQRAALAEIYPALAYAVPLATYRTRPWDTERGDNLVAYRLPPPPPSRFDLSTFPKDHASQHQTFDPLAIHFE